MTRLHALRPQIAFDDVGHPPARVIEIGEITAGIAVPEHGGVRFFSSERSFDTLDGTLFRSVEQAARAARGRRRPVGRL